MTPLERLCGLLAAGADPRPGTAATWRDAADWPWEAMLALADRHLAVPLLAQAVRRLAVPAPDDVAVLLGLVADGNDARNAALRDELLRLARTLNAAGIEPVLLKGAIRLVDDLYPAPGWRFLRDLDLLVPDPALLVRAWRSLAADGYARAEEEGGPATFKPVHHMPRLRHATLGIVAEMHGSLGELCGRSLAPASVASRSTRLVVEGAAMRIPTPSDQLLHLAHHELMQHAALFRGRPRLRDLAEARLLLARGGQALVDECLARATGAERWVLATFLRVAARWLPIASRLRLGGGPSARLGAAWLAATERQPAMARVGALPGFYAHAAILIGRSPARLGHMARGMARPAFYRRRAGEVTRLVRGR